MPKLNSPARQENTSVYGGGSHLDRQIAFLIAAVTLGLLLRSVVRDVLPSDAGEFHFAAWNWGLAHPTGYPLYLLAGGVWQHVWSLVGISPAFSLNALSAVFTAAAAGLFYLLLRRWLPGPVLATRLAAGLGVAFLVANPTLRTQSIQAEVYSLHLLLLVAILLAADRLAKADHPLTPSPSDQATDDCRRPHPLTVLAFLTGLALTHHATTLFLLPPLAIYLFLANRSWWKPWRAWLWAVPAFLLPLLLYLYVPLRGGPDGSPWYHQPFGDGVLSLYMPGWASFFQFITGRSISVGYYGFNEALANVSTAAILWLRHYEWPGLLLAAAGIFVLVRLRNWPMLALTVSYFVLQQVFNLFYAIGDIFVYYIPLYLIGCIWIGFAGAGIGAAFRFGASEEPGRLNAPSPASGPVSDSESGPDAGTTVQTAQRLGTIVLVALFVLPFQLWTRYTTLVEQLQDESTAARATWEEILAADPPANAILVSNDRNEIVPLFYLQTVENRARGNTGLFPLIAPDARFADIGTTVQTALAAGATVQPKEPVYLIKPMDGLEARFALEPATPPLVQVTGDAAAAEPAVAADAVYGPLRLLGYDLQPASTLTGTDTLTETVTLHWQVVDPFPGDYTTTVQVFDAAGSKLAQDDRRAGGDYYPTTLWKPGEVILDRHTLALRTGAQPTRLLVGMYSGPEASLLAPPLELTLD
ncbi:MAG: DUF2723 domain-containing protein [Caldilineaceae bacterium]